MSKFGVKEVMDVTFYDTVTGKPVLFCDTLKLSSLENAADESDARGGKGNPKLLTWDFNRTSSMKVQDALMSPKSFSMLSGNAVTVGAATIHMRQSTVWETVDSVMTNKGVNYPLTATSGGAITLAFTPNEAAADILVYEASDDGGTPLAAGTLSGTTLTNVAWANKEVVAYYTYESGTSAETYIITSDKFPSTYKIVGDTVVRNANTGKDEAFQIVINKAKLKPGFTMEFKSDGDPSVFDMDIEVLKEDASSKMVTMIKY
ncbi:MAG: hypothetical protein LLF98_02095 [Clostridium sp.]|uniref:hypothetical protein n=1 Tax=Clostridium sp. TaxID=1506 RepID=UPI0025C06D1A|nr:hypothetical protein [Clostridium sp.]MCE5220073.1 hypothetical protein [Clostridium sp.]